MNAIPMNGMRSAVLAQQMAVYHAHLAVCAFCKDIHLSLYAVNCSAKYGNKALHCMHCMHCTMQTRCAQMELCSKSITTAGRLRCALQGRPLLSAER